METVARAFHFCQRQSQVVLQVHSTPNLGPANILKKISIFSQLTVDGLAQILETSLSGDPGASLNSLDGEL